MLYLEKEKKVKILENFVESLKKTAKIEYVNEEYNPTDMKAVLEQELKENASAESNKNTEKK